MAIYMHALNSYKHLSYQNMPWTTQSKLHNCFAVCSVWQFCKHCMSLCYNLQISMIPTLTSDGVDSTKASTPDTSATLSDIKHPRWKALDYILDLIKATCVSYRYTPKAYRSRMKSKTTSAAYLWNFGEIIPVATTWSAGVEVEPWGPGCAMIVECPNSVAANG